MLSKKKTESYCIVKGKKIYLHKKKEKKKRPNHSGAPNSLPAAAAAAASPNRRRPLCLTDLPDEVVLEILRRLDTRDAVRTSALSRAWRHHWRHLPVLDFTGSSYGSLGVVSAAHSVLRRHLALVDAVALDARSPPLPEADHPRLDDLLVHLSPPRHALEALILTVPCYKLHSSIYSCVKLKYLDLKGCLLPDSTQGFPGLRNLEGLYVHYTVELEHHLNSAQFDILAALISGCPGLEQLSVKVAPEVPGVTLKIAAPRLRLLQIRACSDDWMVEFQSLLPDLAEAKLELPFFRYAQEGGSELLHILQSISQVEKLELLDGDRLVHFQDMAPFKIPAKLENLQYLGIYADLGDAAHIVLVLDFLRCFPNIRDLRIKLPVSSHVHLPFLEETQEFWNAHGSGDLFRCLRIMKLIDVNLSYNELQFIKLVLSKAHMLEKLTIIHHAEDESSRLKACIEIMKFKRASQEAQINYKVASRH